VIGYHVGMSPSDGQALPDSHPAAEWLRAHSALGNGARKSLLELSSRLGGHVFQQGLKTVVIAGPPGSGKTTLAQVMARTLTGAGQATVLLSLDDYYLSRQERRDLADMHHPLLIRRGVPGTHDWARLVHDIDAIRAGQGQGLWLPVFSKSEDEPEPQSRWRQIDFKPAGLIIEGWCLGTPAQAENQLLSPVNSLEANLDPDARWRRWVNQRLGQYRADLEPRVDQFWHLAVPGWDSVIEWRWRQEQELARPRLASREEVADFLQTFERIARHAQAGNRQWADCRLACDLSHELAWVA